MRTISQSILVIVLLSWAARAVAGGGMILSTDVCIVTIGFYTAHFTGYQPQTQNNTEFCGEFPDEGETVMVLDYLHQSLSEVPVGFRIIRDQLGRGDFVRYEDVQKIQNIDDVTVFYQPPIVKANATMVISHVFDEKGEYIGIVTAGHPTNNSIYTAVFPFTVGVRKIPWGILSMMGALAIGGLYLMHLSGTGKTETA